MAGRRLEEERVNEEIPPQVKQVEQVPQGGQGVQGSKVPPQGDNIPNVEGVNEVPVVHLKFTSQEIREALMA